MGNVASTVARRTSKKRPEKKKKKKENVTNAAAIMNAAAAARRPVPKFIVNSKACTYNAATNHWRCVHRRASTANTSTTSNNGNDWNGFWVNNMPYSFTDEVSTNDKKSKKKNKVR